MNRRRPAACGRLVPRRARSGTTAGPQPRGRIAPGIRTACRPVFPSARTHPAAPCPAPGQAGSASGRPALRAQPVRRHPHFRFFLSGNQDRLFWQACLMETAAGLSDCLCFPIGSRSVFHLHRQPSPAKELSRVKPPGHERRSFSGQPQQMPLCCRRRLCSGGRDRTGGPVPQRGAGSAPRQLGGGNCRRMHPRLRRGQGEGHNGALILLCRPRPLCPGGALFRSGRL